MNKEKCLQNLQGEINHKTYKEMVTSNKSKRDKMKNNHLNVTEIRIKETQEK